MSDDDKADGPRSPRKTMWFVFTSIPVAYVLSFVPVIWMVFLFEDRLSPTWAERIALALEIFYAPLGWIAERVPWLEQFLEWYANLFD